MGADLMLARSRWPQYEDGIVLESESARAVLHERCDVLEVVGLVELYNGTVSAYEDEDGIDTSELGSSQLAEMARRRLHAAIHAVTGEGSWRELASMPFDGKEWILTGGMSWGDTPTEVFASVAILGDSGICGAPVSRSAG